MYFDEEYANGKIFELAGMKIDTVKLYSEQIKNPEITITQMSFEDGDERLDFGPSVLYSNKSSSKKSSSSDYSSDGYDDGYDDFYSDGEPDWTGTMKMKIMQEELTTLWTNMKNTEKIGKISDSSKYCFERISYSKNRITALDNRIQIISG